MLRKGSATGQWSIPMVLGLGISVAQGAWRGPGILSLSGVFLLLWGVSHEVVLLLWKHGDPPAFLNKDCPGHPRLQPYMWRSYLMAASASTPRKRQSIPGNFAELMPGPFGGRLTWTALFRTWSSVSARGTTRTSSPRPPAAWLPRW